MGAWRAIGVEFVNLDPRWQKVGGEEEETKKVARTDQEEEGGSGKKRDEQSRTCSAIASHELLLTETPLSASRVWGPNPKVKLVLTYKVEGVAQENVEDWKQTCIKNWSPHITQYGEPTVTVTYLKPFDMSQSNPSPDDFKIQIHRGKLALNIFHSPQEAIDWKGYPEDFPTTFMATTAKLLPNPYVDWAKDVLEPTDHRGWCLTGWPLSDVLRRHYTSIANYPETETQSETNTHARFAWRRLKQEGDSSILPFRRGYSEQGLQTLLMQDDDIRKIFPFQLHDQKIVEVENCAKIALHQLQLENGRCVIDLENEEEFSCVYSYAEAAVEEFNENQIFHCLSLKEIEKAYLTLALGKAYDIVFSAHDCTINNQCSCLATVIDSGNEFWVESFSRIIEGSPFFLPRFHEIVSGQ
ncbi:hypothetical protein Tsubulata_032208 [Turnera subulata]|uniref:Uncharacterized protein n=1 Tax=Turnera subulata TaxID=218843 RepID=A0A9Q0F1Q8_9ROSI|nr:hypothetical protein Tsubulata_032208 [Turnera subulata]